MEMRWEAWVGGCVHSERRGRACLCSQSSQWNGKLVSAVGGAVVITVVDQQSNLPAVRALRDLRLVAAGQHAHCAHAGSRWVGHLSQDLGLSLQRTEGTNIDTRTLHKSNLKELTKQSQQAHGGEDRLPDKLHMRRLGVVDLETGGQGSLREGKGVVTKEGIVVAKEGVVDGIVGVSEQQVLVLVDHLVNIRSV